MLSLDSRKGTITAAAILIVLLSIGVGGCKEYPSDNARPDDHGGLSAPDYSVVRLFYATDRKPINSQLTGVSYSEDRSESEGLSLGTLDVSIPKDHRMGEIERPFKILKYEFREDPSKHVVLLKVVPKPQDAFFPELKNSVQSSTHKEAFVFIHGYEVTFPEAARRTAQMAYDLSFDGAAILYSWPSRGTYSGYPADEATIEWTTPHLKQFLEELATESHATTIYVIAHSMGNRALTRALSAISTEKPAVIPKFEHVFLAAPDIDADVFKQLAATFPLSSNHVTLYASSKDEALIASKKFHQDLRAGESTPITVVPGVDTVDATAVDTGFIGHSYYGDNRSILSDIFQVMHGYRPPGDRFGMKPNRPQKPLYWLFRP